jgi:hypothetical protein
MATVRFSWWGQGEPPIDQTEEEIARVAKVEIARAERLAWELQFCNIRKLDYNFWNLGFKVVMVLANMDG